MSKNVVGYHVLSYKVVSFIHDLQYLSNVNSKERVEYNFRWLLHKNPNFRHWHWVWLMTFILLCIDVLCLAKRPPFTSWLIIWWPEINIFERCLLHVKKLLYMYITTIHIYYTILTWYTQSLYLDFGLFYTFCTFTESFWLQTVSMMKNVFLFYVLLYFLIFTISQSCIFLWNKICTKRLYQYRYM